MTHDTHHTDLSHHLAAIREDALRRLRVAEGRDGRALEYVHEAPPGGGPNRWRKLSTDELVERLEGHADTWILADELGSSPPGGLGSWAA